MNLDIILFVLSSTACIYYLHLAVSTAAGNGVDVPIPFLHFFSIDYSACYISTPAIAYQAYFWSTHFNLFAT